MKTERINNAAGRLHRLLCEIRRHNEKVEQPAATVWAMILNVPDGNRPALFRRMAFVVGLPDQIEREVKRIPDLDHHNHLTWRPKVDTLLANMDFNGKFGQIGQLIDDPTLSLLSICDHAIANISPALSIDRGRLDGLLTQIRKLVEELGFKPGPEDDRSEVPQELQDFILRHLHTIEQSIVDYQFQGVEALRTGLETAVGIAMVNPQPFDDALKSPVGQKLAKILGTYVLILSGVYGTRQLVTDVVKLLPGVDAIQAEEALEGEVLGGDPTGAAVEQEATS